MNWEILSLTRFLLALVVMLEHLQITVPIGIFHWYTYLGSFEAVLGFLLISGLSIGKSISNNPNNYFKRRIQRIYPVYAFSLIFQMSVAGIVLNSKFILLILLNLLFLNQVFTFTSYVIPAWSLALEVWLYCLSPLFLKLSKKSFYSLIFLSFLCYVIYTCGHSFFHWDYFFRVRFGLNLVFLSFIWLAGFAFSIFPENKRYNTILIAILIAGHLGLTIAIEVFSKIKNHQGNVIVDHDLLYFIGKSLCLASVFIVVVFNNKIPPFKPVTKKVFNLLGNLSYPLYLTHTTTYRLLRQIHLNNMLLMILSSLTASLIVYLIIDRYSKRRAYNYIN